MKTLLLDSSFLISAAKKKIDIFEELQEYKILIPEQVIQEIFRISQSKQTKKTRDSAELAIKILEVTKSKFKKIDLGTGHTDTRIVKYAKENPEILVATLDKEIKSKLKGRVIILQGNKVKTN
jgi:uncharacterized protein